MVILCYPYFIIIPIFLGGARPVPVWLAEELRVCPDWGRSRTRDNVPNQGGFTADVRGGTTASDPVVHTSAVTPLAALKPGNVPRPAGEGVRPVVASFIRSRPRPGENIL